MQIGFKNHLFKASYLTGSLFLTPLAQFPQVSAGACLGRGLCRPIEISCVLPGFAAGGETEHEHFLERGLSLLLR